MNSYCGLKIEKEKEALLGKIKISRRRVKKSGQFFAIGKKVSDCKRERERERWGKR